MSIRVRTTSLGLDVLFALKCEISAAAASEFTAADANFQHRLDQCLEKGHIEKSVK